MNLSLQSTEKIKSQPFLPKVAVIVPIYNGEEDLPELIQCLYAQTYPRERVEYFLVDNASRDRTAEMIKTAAKKAESEKLIIKYLSEPNIQSSYSARNVGIRTSLSEFIVFTDVDCRPQSNWLLEMVQPFADNDVGIVGGAVKPLPGKTLLEEYAKRKETLSHTFGHSYEPPFALGASLAIRRQAFQQVGLFRPYLTTSGDIDICWRIMKTGSWKFFSAEQAITLHRHRRTLKELTKQWRRYGSAFQYVYELYGIHLLGEPGWGKEKIFKMWLRWLVNEMPRNSIKMILGRGTLLDWLMKPIALITQMAQYAGRKDIKLTQQISQIEWL